MAKETNQDSQDPTQDQPPPKQYAGQRPQEHGSDQRRPNIPDRVEKSEGNDDDKLSGGGKSGYDEDASVKGTSTKTGTQSPTKPGQSGSGGQKAPQGGQGSPRPGSGSSGSGGSGGAGSRGA
jgi:hypothetical protein